MAKVTTTSLRKYEVLYNTNTHTHIETPTDTLLKGRSVKQDVNIVYENPMNASNNPYHDF